MNEYEKLNILLIDEGMNTGALDSNKIGGGQIARKRFLSKGEYFIVHVLTSEMHVANLWENDTNVIYKSGLKTNRPTRSEINKNPLKLISLIKDAFAAIVIIRKIIKNRDFDLIFLNDNKSRLLFILFKLRYLDFWKTRTAIQVDGEWNNGIYDIFMKFIYLIMFDNLICSTHAIKSQFGLLGKLFKKKLCVIYPGIDKSYISSRKPLNKDYITFGNIGTVRFNVKGQDIILDAIEKVIHNSKIRNLKCNFYGDGPDLPRLRKLVSIKKLDNYFRFYGFVKDHDQIYNNIDICIISSRTEVAPLVLMECIIRNIPVIVPDLPGTIEIVNKFYRELVFKKGDYVSMADIMNKCISEKYHIVVKNKLENSNKDIITLEYQIKRLYNFLSN